MKKASSVTSKRRVNTNPSFPISDISKASPKNSSTTTNAYFLKNPTTLTYNMMSRLDVANKSHSPRHLSLTSTLHTASGALSNNPGFLLASTATPNQSQQPKTPRNFQSPIQKSPINQLTKGKSLETNFDFNRIINQSIEKRFLSTSSHQPYGSQEF